MALRLDIRHYETVAAIVEHTTVTKAAVALSISQSALSHRLADAEERMGVKLFDRGPGRRLQPTEAGIIVQQAATLALAELGRCEDDILRSSGRYRATVRIAVQIYENYHWFVPFLKRLREAHPTIDVQLVVIGGTAARSLDSREVDIVIAAGEPVGGLASVSLFVDELAVMVAPTHRLARRHSVEPLELEDETYLTYSRVRTPGFEYERFLSKSAIRPRLITVVEHVSAIAELVAADIGFSVLSRWAMTSMIESGRIAAVRCGAEGLPVEWHALMRATEPSLSAVRDVAELLAADMS
ncbi:MAG: LysR family transcriptional regulator [Acidimicrobiales bacterium]